MLPTSKMCVCVDVCVDVCVCVCVWSRASLVVPTSVKPSFTRYPVDTRYPKQGLECMYAPVKGLHVTERQQAQMRERECMRERMNVREMHEREMLKRECMCSGSWQ